MNTSKSVIKEMGMAKKISGIYQITNNLTGQFYIGSSQNTTKRKYTHFSQLRHNKHPNQHLQRAFAKYGEAAFSFHVVARCSINKLLKTEQLFLDELQPHYNIATDAASGMRGRKHTPEAVASMKAKLKGRKLTKQWKKRISEAHKGKVQGPHSEEHKRKISEGNKGKVLPQEVKNKISKANKGRKRSAEVRKANGERKSIAVIRICPKTGEQKIYPSMTAAKEEGGFDQTNISRCCRGLQKTHKSYIWKFAA